MMCTWFGIHCIQIYGGNHRSVSVDIFYIYLNKVQRIIIVDTHKMSAWVEGIYVLPVHNSW